MRLFRRRDPFGLVTGPPSTVGELTQALEIRSEDLWDGRPLTGHLGPRPSDAPALSEHVRDVAVAFAWDMYHERPVESLERLAAKELEEFTVHFVSGHERSAARLRNLEAAVAALPGRGSCAIDPPAPALEVARLLGDPDPVAHSHDVHMSSWSFTVGDVRAWLSHGASGQVLETGPVARRRLGERDRVWRLSLVDRGDE